MAHGHEGEPGADGTKEARRNLGGISREGTAHTPGPWESHYKFTPASKHLEVQTAGGQTLAHVYAHADTGSIEQAEVEANGELMAAAPDLLATARETLVAFENTMPKHLYKNACFNWEIQPDDCPCLAHKIRGLIDKAAA